ncbi:hypothetical protein FE257_001057 [Aspergillus nanangensis]|uniref:Uncharacterized protein n=1 Tax=Aspergillus nanangensis TaxID=2582783 RepID=A0AAD4CTY5_ASPNN|nr:hypothetical protein FE257_001057 [Aspergillus nanangensis]
MVDPLSALGLAYPVTRDLLKIARKLKRVCHEMNHATENLEKIISRVDIVAETYKLFTDTMNDTNRIDDLATTTQNPTAEPIQRWISQFEWYRAEKRSVVPLLLEMQILEGSMSLIANLVIIRMLQRSERRDTNGQHSIYVQIKLLTKSMSIGFKTLEDHQRAQARILERGSATRNQDVSPNQFSQEVLRLLKREIPKLKPHHTPGNRATPDPGPPSRSRVPSNRGISTATSARPDPHPQDQEPVFQSPIAKVSGQIPEAPSNSKMIIGISCHYQLPLFSQSPPLSQLSKVKLARAPTLDQVGALQPTLLQMTVKWATE